MKRKTSPIPPGVTMLSTDLMDYHLNESNLSHLRWWRDDNDYKGVISLKVKCAAFLSYKASTSTVDNNKRYLHHKFKESLEMEERRKNPTITHYGYRNPSPFDNLVPNIAVQQIKNEPISGIRLVGVATYLANQDEILVVLPGDLLYVMPMVSVVEAAARGDIVKGVFQSEFIWASTGSKFALIRKDSPYHQSFMQTGDE